MKWGRVQSDGTASISEVANTDGVILLIDSKFYNPKQSLWEIIVNIRYHMQFTKTLSKELKDYIEETLFRAENLLNSKYSKMHRGNIWGYIQGVEEINEPDYVAEESMLYSQLKMKEFNSYDSIKEYEPNSNEVGVVIDNGNMLAQVSKEYRNLILLYVDDCENIHKAIIGDLARIAGELNFKSVDRIHEKGLFELIRSLSYIAQELVYIVNCTSYREGKLYGFDIRSQVQEENVYDFCERSIERIKQYGRLYGELRED